MKSDALTIDELSDLITAGAGENVIGRHIWVEDLDSGLLYAAIADMDSKGIVAIWSVDSLYREADYGRTWVAYKNLSVGKREIGFKPFAVGEEKEGWDVEFDDSDDEDDDVLIDLAKERLARYRKRR